MVFEALKMMAEDGVKPKGIMEVELPPMLDEIANEAIPQEYLIGRMGGLTDDALGSE